MLIHLFVGAILNVKRNVDLKRTWFHVELQNERKMPLGNWHGISLDALKNFVCGISIHDELELEISGYPLRR